MIGLKDIAKRAVFVIDRNGIVRHGSAGGRAERAGLRQGRRRRSPVAVAPVNAGFELRQAIVGSMADTAVAAGASVRCRTISKPSARCSARFSSRTTRSTWRRRSSTAATSIATRTAASSTGWCALNERNHAIDFVTLKEELSRGGELDEVGGPAYVASLADGVPRATNVEYYARIVKEKSTLRNLIFAANKILDQRLRGRAGIGPDPRRGRERDLRRRRRPAEGRLRRRCAIWSRRASRRSSSSSSRSGSSPACRPASPTSTR